MFIEQLIFFLQTCISLQECENPAAFLLTGVWACWFDFFFFFFFFFFSSLHMWPGCQSLHALSDEYLKKFSVCCNKDKFQEWQTYIYTCQHRRCQRAVRGWDLFPLDSLICHTQFHMWLYSGTGGCFQMCIYALHLRKAYCLDWGLQLGL